MDQIPAFDRVSIRAVLVTDGQNPQAALAEAGIFDPIALPVVMGDEPDLSGGILGDGITPNLIGVLETEQQDASDPTPPPQPARGQSDDAQPTRATTGMLPPAFGLRSLAPIRNRQS